MLAPLSLGYVIPFGAEAVTHSAHLFLRSLSPGHVLLNDFKNTLTVLDTISFLKQQVTLYLKSILSYIHVIPLLLTFMMKLCWNLLRVFNRVIPWVHFSFVWPLILSIWNWNLSFRVSYLDNRILGDPEVDVFTRPHDDQTWGSNLWFKHQSKEDRVDLWGAILQWIVVFFFCTWSLYWVLLLVSIPPL